MDYEGAIGVPITFLHKFNPLQFEIIQFRKGIDGKDLSINAHLKDGKVVEIFKNGNWAF